jgi:aminoglycoside phosphotransferase (APT) family kinase protein
MSADTTTDRAIPGVDTDRLEAWFAAHVPDLVRPYGYDRIGEGQSNLTYRVTDAAGRSVVLRRPPLGEILASAHDMAREYFVLSALSAVGAPVPRTLAYCEDESVTGATFYVMEHVDGIVLSTTAAAQRLDPAARRGAALDLARTLARLHEVDLDGAGLGALRRPGSLAERQLRRWTGQWNASKTRELPAIDELAARLARGRPDEREQVLVHGDYHLGNTIVGRDGAVLAVVDWELCTVGDPLADVGLMIAYWNEMAIAARREDALFREPVTALAGFPADGELAAEYERATGRDLTELGFWVAFAYWKVAIIVEGVYRRWLNDPANGSDAGSLRPAVDRLASVALEALAQPSWSEVGSGRSSG